MAKPEPVKKNILQKSRIVHDGPPPIHALNLNEVVRNEADNIHKYEFGNSNMQSQTTDKVIMVVGATGAGKTTFINGLINYVFGVKWEDPYRFKLVIEKEKTQAESQTSSITSYTIHHQVGFKILYTLTIIDTPGFGDTSSIDRDKDITKQMHSFFSTKGIGGIDHIDAIGFVVQSSLPRLTAAQKYIFHSVLSIFGKDIKDNIFMLATFADSHKNPPVMAAIDAAELPYKAVLNFNNSALFVDTRCADDDDDDDEEEEEEDEKGDGGFQRLHWKMGIKSFKRFFKELGEVEPKSLLLTKEVLDERGQLEADIAGLRVTIKSAQTKLQQLNTETELLNKHKKDIEDNKNFQYTVKEEVVVKKKVRENVTNCTQCDVTCHHPCLLKHDIFRMTCQAMSWGNCRICPGKCSWKMHKNTGIIFEMEKRDVKKDFADLKKRYEAAQGAKLTAEQIVKKHKDECDYVQFQVLELTEDIRKSVNRLREISLTKNPLSSVEYIKLLLETEKKENGFSENYRQLEILKEQAEFLSQVQKPDYDPLKEYKQNLGKNERGNFTNLKKWMGKY